MPDAITLMRLLQLASSTLPVGAYSYSEGLEYLVDCGTINSPDRLHHWLAQELSCGAIRVEAAVLVRAYEAIATQNLNALWYWNNWLSAARETEELRYQSWQMGQSLMRLLPSLQPDSDFSFANNRNCNFAIAFAIAAANWQIDRHTAAIAYLYSWASNLVGAGVKLIPLGQTMGQQILRDLQPQIANTAQQVIQPGDDVLEACTWGLSLASMAHETQYTRLFRS
ncbi:urease accessory UreF family protein [Pseudanabaena sp. PCC 6802]|uniref:urease accessory protein UreF n=1 Tax=Pseudanabaena sp. PCC 6802 TaxID=118173 RepID=UPI00034B63E0